MNVQAVFVNPIYGAWFVDSYSTVRAEVSLDDTFASPIVTAELPRAASFVSGPVVWEESTFWYLREQVADAAPAVFVRFTDAESGETFLDRLEPTTALPAPTLSAAAVSSPLRLTVDVAAITPEEVAFVEFRVADAAAALDAAEVLAVTSVRQESFVSATVDVVLSSAERRRLKYLQARFAVDYALPSSLGTQVGRRGPWSTVFVSDPTGTTGAADSARLVTTVDIAPQAIDASLISGSALTESVFGALTVGTDAGLGTISTPDFRFEELAVLMQPLDGESPFTPAPTEFSVNESVVPDVVPFTILIDNEQMYVTARTAVPLGNPNSFTYTVRRGYASTPISSHADFAKVYIRRPQGSVTLYSNGLTFTSAGGETGLTLPATGDAQFRGIVLAKQLVADYAKFRSTALIDANTTLSMSAGAVASPAVAPQVTVEYPNYLKLEYQSLWNMNFHKRVVSGFAGPEERHFAWTAVPYSANTAREYDIEALYTNSETPESAWSGWNVEDETPFISREIAVPGECHSAVQVGNYVFVLWYAGNATTITTMTISAYRASDLLYLRDIPVTVRGYEPGLFRDPVSGALCLVDVDTYTGGKSGQMTGIRVRSWQVAGSGDNASLVLTLRGDCTTANPDGTATGAGLPVSGANHPTNVSLAATVRNVGDLNVAPGLYVTVSDYRLESVVKGAITRGTVSGVSYIRGLSVSTDDDSLFSTPWGAAPWGIQWDNEIADGAGGFVFLRDDAAMFGSSLNTSTPYWFWAQSFATLDASEAFQYSTLLSTSVQRSLLPYCSFIITSNTGVPSAAEAWGYFASPDNFDFYYQDFLRTDGGIGGVPYLRIDEPSTSVPAPTLSTFPGGTAAEIAPSVTGTGWAAPWVLKGDGTADNLLSYKSTVVLSGDVQLSTTMSDLTGLEFTSLPVGTWMVHANVTFQNTGNQSRDVEAKIIMGSSVWIVAGQSRVTNGDWMTMSLTGLVTLTSVQTVKVRARVTTATSTVSAKMLTDSGSVMGESRVGSTAFAVRIA